MREILFRGKQKEGRWVEGVYFKHDTIKVCFSSDDPKPRHLIIQDGFCDWGFEPPIHCVDVSPETVGQFTGLTDTNGTKVFEGDILKFTDKNADYEWIGKVEFGNPNAEYNWGFQLVYIKGTKPNTDILLWFDMEETGAYSKVIGNIHDNPELLEVTDND